MIIIARLCVLCTSLIASNTIALGITEQFTIPVAPKLSSDGRIELDPKEKPLTKAEKTASQNPRTADLFSLPSSPKDCVQTYHPNRTNIMVKWCYPENNGGSDVTHFKIETAQFKKDKDRRSFVQYSKDWKLDAVMSSDQFSKKVVGLLPGMFYCVRVYAKNVKGWGPPSALSAPIETLPSKPYWGDDQLAPWNTNADIIEKGKDWTTVQFQSTEHNGGRVIRQFIFYLVESPPTWLEDIAEQDWTEWGKMSAPPEDDDEAMTYSSFLDVDTSRSLLFSMSLLDLEATSKTKTQTIHSYSYKLEGLKADTDYAMRYISENEVGRSTPSKMVSFKTLQTTKDVSSGGAGAPEEPKPVVVDTAMSGRVEKPLPGPMVVWKCPSNCITNIKEYCLNNPQECKSFCEDEMNCKCGSKLHPPSPSPIASPSPSPLKPVPSPKPSPKVLKIVKLSPLPTSPKPTPSPLPTPSPPPPTPSPNPSPSPSPDEYGAARGYTLKFFSNGKSKVVYRDGAQRLIEN